MREGELVGNFSALYGRKACFGGLTTHGGYAALSYAVANGFVAQSASEASVYACDSPLREGLLAFFGVSCAPTALQDPALVAVCGLCPRTLGQTCNRSERSPRVLSLCALSFIAQSESCSIFKQFTTFHHQITKSPNHRIATSPNHQITKSPHHLTTPAPTRSRATWVLCTASWRGSPRAHSRMFSHNTLMRATTSKQTTERTSEQPLTTKTNKRTTPNSLTI